MIRESGARVEELLASFDRPMPPGQSRARAEELVRELVRLYGEGLDRVLAAVDEAAGSSASRVFARLCDDPLVSGLLAIHGLHPLTPLERVQRALDGVRPYVESHKGSVDVLSVEDGVVSLRMSGSCEGCPSSQVTLKLAIEKAIFENCPDVSEVRAEDAVPAAVADTPSLRLMSDWVAVGDLGDIDATGYATLVVSGMPVIVLRVDGSLYAYRNHCPSCTRELSSASLMRDVLSCGWCGRGYDAVRAGRANDGGAPLEPYPLLHEDGRVRVAIPLTA